MSPVYSWGGIYFGFNLGYGFGTSNWTDPSDPGGATGNSSVKGFLAGATLGANFQTDAFVYGAEADFDGSFMDGKKSSPFCSAGTQCETKNFWFSTLRARLGYAADRVLFYGTEFHRVVRVCRATGEAGVTAACGRAGAGAVSQFQVQIFDSRRQILGEREAMVEIRELAEPIAAIVLQQWMSRLGRPDIEEEQIEKLQEVVRRWMHFDGELADLLLEYPQLQSLFYR